jgi:hypothetical protein
LHPDPTARQSYGSEETALKNSLLRLLHHDGYVPRKIALESTGESAAEREDTSVKRSSMKMTERDIPRFSVSIQFNESTRSLRPPYGPVASRYHDA